MCVCDKEKRKDNIKKRFLCNPLWLLSFILHARAGWLLLARSFFTFYTKHDEKGNCILLYSMYSSKERERINININIKKEGGSLYLGIFVVLVESIIIINNEKKCSQFYHTFQRE